MTNLNVYKSNAFYSWFLLLLLLLCIIIIFNFIKMNSISVDFQKSTAMLSMYGMYCKYLNIAVHNGPCCAVATLQHSLTVSEALDVRRVAPF